MMNTVLICNFIFLLTLMSATAEKVTFASVYNGFMKLEHDQEEACLKENNLSEAMIGTMVDSISKNGVFPDQREYKCFFTCMLLKSKCINEKGELLLDNIHEIAKNIHTTILDKFLKDCASKINEKDSCERGMLIEKCFSGEVQLIIDGKI